jgi:ABC-type branched-subunit amino acid transport system substrate-binding protein
MSKKLLNLLLVIMMLAVSVPTVLAAPPAQEEGQDYVVVADDWLSKLADKYLGNPLAYPAITHYTNQKQKEDSSYAKITDSDLIEVGWKIYIPSAAEATAYLEAPEVKTVATGEDTIKIGGIGPLSSPGSVVGGIAMKFAMELAVKDINDAGGVMGKPIELIFADTEGLPERGVAVAERLITENKVVAITGEYHSAVGIPVADVCHEYGVPVLFSETWSDKITETGYPEVFRIAPASSMNARATMEWFAAVGVKHFVSIAENTDYGIGQTEQDEKFATELGMTVDEVFFVELGTEDFLPVLSRIQAMDPPPDAIRMAVTGETSYNVEQQMAELGIAPSEKIIGTANQVAIQPEFWESVPNGNYYVYSLVGLPPSLYNDTTNYVADAYKADFDTDPPSYALEAYDSIRILADAIERAGTTEPKALIDALEDTDINLAQGHYYFKYTSKNPLPADGSVAAYMWHQWPDPAVLLLQYFEPNQDWKEAAVVWPEVYQTHGTSYIVPGTTP